MPALALALALAQRLRSLTWSRYLAVSIAALAVDLCLFLMLARGGAPLPVVSALSYGAGIAVHWALSSRLVFAGDLRAAGAARTGQQALFVLSALVGLALTMAIVSGLGLLVDARLAKLIAVGVSFQVTYLLRSRIVFA